MAKAKDRTDDQTSNKGQPGTDLAATGGGALALSPTDFMADAGAGMEGATQESFAIPFLSVLQKSSPQVDETSGVAIEGARQGMFYENVTGRLFDGKVGVQFIPCAYRRVFLRWGARDVGGGFKGELTPEEVTDQRMRGKIVDLDGRLLYPLPDGSVNDKKCDRVADVRNHYILLLSEDGTWTQALLSLASTQIKKSKMLMSALASVKLKAANGSVYTPPTFANVVRATTVPESNDKGSWMGIRFELAGTVDRADAYAAARAFHESVRSGSVTAKYEEGAADGDAGAPAKDGF